MGVLTDAGRAAMMKAIKEQTMFLALGTGRTEWGDTPPSEESTATELVSEVGRKALTRSFYVTPDDEFGTIEVPVTITENEDGDGEVTVSTQKYKVSETPTRHLYVEFALDFADAVGQTIRELGLFVGAVLKDEAEQEKRYFTQEDFKDLGLLFQIENREPMIRRAETRDTFMWVISI